ncbi:MAG: pyruvate dehydrogenase complex E1 component subunit beta [Candidatus Brocadiia bacterium]
MVREISVHPEFEPKTLEFPDIPAFQYDGSLDEEIEQGHITEERCLDLLEWMLSIRAFEQMILALRHQQFAPLRKMNFQYRGPTHLSLGQEATSVGACSAIGLTDYITSTHRGHGDGIAKGYAAIKERDEDQLRAWLGPDAATGLKGEELRQKAKDEHIYRTIAELFGKDDGYCRGRGGGMHIADFTSGHLGANAIVGGSVPLATGAGYSCRYKDRERIAVCFAGDGAYANGVVLESLNMSSMAQFTNELAEDPFGVPTVYVIVNNQYGMTGQQEGEVTGVDYLARRAAGFHPEAMHAEVVNGMNVLAVRDALRSAAETARKGQGPVLRELMCYRYQGHSLSDPRTEYRQKDEEKAWKEKDPIENFKAEIVEAGVADENEIEELDKKVQTRHEEAAVRAAKADDPPADEVTKFVFTDGFASDVPEEFSNPEIRQELPYPERKDGTITCKEALREAMIEEMSRDERVIIYGEDVADYGGAFKVTKGLLESFGRDRVFNTSISEAAIVGTGVGAAMTGMRPVVELMYSDFEFMAGDQLYNQAAKWHYMSGGRNKVPMVLRTSTGAGKGYGGQHSQALESHSTHTPGLKVVYASTPYDAKGLLKTAIRDDNPVVFVESQQLYNRRGEVPQEDYLVPFGEAALRRSGDDVTIVAWGFVADLIPEVTKKLAQEHGIEAEFIDPRTLIPLDMETIVESIRKTGSCVVASQACRTGSYTAEVASRIEEEAFDYLDAPIERIGSADSVSPQSEVLEKAFLPQVEDVVEAALRSCYAD